MWRALTGAVRSADTEFKRLLMSPLSLLVAIFSHYFSLLLCYSLYSLLLSWLVYSFCFAFFCQHFLLFRLSLLVFSSESVAVHSDCFLLPASSLALLSSSFTLFSFSFLLVSFFHALCAAAFLRDVCRSRAETKLCHLPRVTHVLPLRSPRLSCSSRMHACPAAVCHH